MNEREILARFDAFERATFPVTEWNHAAHLLVGLVYVHRYGREEAAARMREGLQRYNIAVGGNPDGYHETLTRAWLEVIASVHAAHPGEPLEAVAHALLERRADQFYLLRFYSRELLMTDAARRGWIEPDIAPIA